MYITHKGFLKESSQIFTKKKKKNLHILTDISSWPTALLKSRDLIIFSMSFSEKIIDVNLTSVSKSSERGKELLLLRGVHLEAKTY